LKSFRNKKINNNKRKFKKFKKSKNLVRFKNKNLFNKTKLLIVKIEGRVSKIKALIKYKSNLLHFKIKRSKSTTYKTKLMEIKINLVNYSKN